MRRELLLAVLLASMVTPPPGKDYEACDRKYRDHRAQCEKCKSGTHCEEGQRLHEDCF